LGTRTGNGYGENAPESVDFDKSWRSGLMAGLSLLSKTLTDSVQQLLIAGSAASSPVSTPPPTGANFVSDDATDNSASFDGEGLLDGTGMVAVVAPTLGYAADVMADLPTTVGASDPGRPLDMTLDKATTPQPTAEHAVALPPEATATGDASGLDIPASAIPGRDGETAKTKILSKGGISLAGGYSSLQGATLEASLVRSGLADGTQELSATFSRSGLQRALELGFADGDLFDSGVVLGATVFTATRQALGFSGRRNASPFAEHSNGLKLRLAGKLSEGLSIIGHYRLSRDAIRLNRNGGASCDAILRGSVACGALGSWMTSTAGVALALDRRDNPDNPTRGYRLKFGQDFAWLGGGARYTRPSVEASAHLPIGESINLTFGAEGGLIRALGGKNGRGAVPIFERFFLGGGDLRGFDLRGVGPRVVRMAPDGTLLSGLGASTPVGGRGYYRARAELGFTLGGKLGRMGLKPALFADIGSVFGARASGLLSSATAQTVPVPATNGAAPTTQTLPAFTEVLTGNASRPRVAVGAGLGWVTPLGELRFDLAKVVKKQVGDVTQPFAISFGTRF
jgi:outer membrane protein insertion porin family